MLALDRLTMVDFGPYRGRQEIVFSREDGVYLVYGPNEWGRRTCTTPFGTRCTATSSIGTGLGSLRT